MKTKTTPKPDETMEDVIMDMEKRATPHDIFKNGEQFGTTIITGDDLMTYAERLRAARKRELETYENLRKITEEKIRRQVAQEIVGAVLC